MDQDRQHAKEAFQAMSFMEKVEYLIQNYWVTAAVTVAVGALLISLIGRMTWNRPADKVVGIGVHAASIDMDLVAEMKEKITEKYPAFTEDGREFYVYWFYSGYTSDQVEQIQTTAYKLAGAVASGQIDIMVGDEETLFKDAQQELLMNLTELFSEEEIEAIRERAMEINPEIDPIVLLSFDISGDTGRTVRKVRDEAFLLRLPNVEAIMDEVLIYQETCIGIVANADNPEETRDLIFTMLGMMDRVSDVRK